MRRGRVHSGAARPMWVSRNARVLASAPWLFSSTRAARRPISAPTSGSRSQWSQTRASSAALRTRCQALSLVEERRNLLEVVHRRSGGDRCAVARGLDRVVPSGGHQCAADEGSRGPRVDRREFAQAVEYQHVDSRGGLAGSKCRFGNPIPTSGAQKNLIWQPWRRHGASAPGGAERAPGSARSPPPRLPEGVDNLLVFASHCGSRNQDRTPICQVADGSRQLGQVAWNPDFELQVSGDRDSLGSDAEFDQAAAVEFGLHCKGFDRLKHRPQGVGERTAFGESFGRLPER